MVSSSAPTQKMKDEMASDFLRPSLLVMGQMSRQATKAPACWSPTARELTRVACASEYWKSWTKEARVKTPPGSVRQTDLNYLRVLQHHIPTLITGQQTRHYIWGLGVQRKELTFHCHTRKGSLPSRLHTQANTLEPFPKLNSASCQSSSVISNRRSGVCASK